MSVDTEYYPWKEKFVRGDCGSSITLPGPVFPSPSLSTERSSNTERQLLASFPERRLWVGGDSIVFHFPSVSEQ